MLETCADHEHALPNADLRAEVERLRTEVRALRRENLELRAVLAANREMADPTAGGCSMELTAGTSIGTRRPFERRRRA
jgi:hypothetical protein